jgi:uncharacterized membrane protein YebE (DUF533 family)
MKTTKSKKNLVKRPKALQMLGNTDLKTVGIAVAGVSALAGVAYLVMKKFKGGSVPQVEPGKYDDDATKKHEQAMHFGNGTRDKVDQQVWESFPASDPAGNY